MADFTQAVKWMKERKKVRRNGLSRWIFQTAPIGEYIEIQDNDENKEKRFHIADFEATDWEVCEEEFNLKEERIKLFEKMQKEVTLTKPNEILLWAFSLVRDQDEEFIKKSKEERCNLFRKFLNSGKDHEGLIKKKDWDNFMIKCDKLEGNN